MHIVLYVCGLLRPCAYLCGGHARRYAHMQSCTGVVLSTEWHIPHLSPPGADVCNAISDLSPHVEYLSL